MAVDRRSFLKVFGVSSAMVANVAGETELLRQREDMRPPDPQTGGEHAWEAKRQFHSTVSAVLYDRLDIPKNGMEHTHSFFNGMYGTPNPRGPEETNVYGARKLDAPELFKVDAVGITFDPQMTEAHRNYILRNYALDLWIGQKTYCKVPLIEAFGQGSDPTVNFKTLFRLDIPLILSWEHSFYVSIIGKPPPVSPKLSMWAVLHGQKAWGVS